MQNDNITFLNPDFDGALIEFRKTCAREPSKCFLLAKLLLKEVLNSGELNYAIREIEGELPKLTRVLSPQQIWSGISGLISTLDFVPARESKTPELKGYTEFLSSAQNVSAAWASNQVLRMGSLRKNAPFAEIEPLADDAHNELDKNLANIAQLFVDPSARPRVAGEESINLVRSLIITSIQSLLNGTPIDCFVEHLDAARIETDVDAAKRLLITGLTFANVAAYDLLYSSDNHREDSSQIIIQPSKRNAGQDEDVVGLICNQLLQLRRCLTSENADRATRVVGLLGLHEALLPPIKAALMEELSACVVRGSQTKGRSDDGAGITDGILERAMGSLEDEALDTNDLAGLLLRSGAGVYESKQNITERLRSMESVGTLLNNHADFFDAHAIESWKGPYKHSLCLLWKDVSNLPRSGSRLESPGFVFSDGFGNKLDCFDCILFARKNGDSSEIPAFFQILDLMDTDSYSYEAGSAFGLRDNSYLAAVSKCIKEGMCTTAARLMEYWLVTTRFESAAIYSITSGNAYGLIAEARVLVSRIRRQVSCARLRRALDLAIQLHRSYHRIDAHSSDFVIQELEEMSLLLQESYSSLENVPKFYVSDFYKSRLSRISNGASSNWSEAILSHFERLENIRDFTLGSQSSQEVINQADFAWVVSYHKMIESPLRQKLSFIFREDFQSQVQRILKEAPPRRFEIFQALRIFERIERTPGCQSLLDAISEKGIDLLGGKEFLRKVVDISKLRNVQAHDFGSRSDAEAHREWVLRNFDEMLRIFSISETEVENALLKVKLIK